MAERARIARVQGSRDLEYGEHRFIQNTQESLQRTLLSFGYTPIATPILEHTELYLRKSGSEVASRLYSLTDPAGGRLSLRPEFTASVIRTYIEREQSALHPVRWQYSGPVFRYDDPAVVGYRQFSQVGAELIGSSSLKADAEIIALANSAINDLGVHKHRLVIGHASLLPNLLEGIQLSERAKMVILGGVNLLRKGDSGAKQLRERLEATRARGVSLSDDDSTEQLSSLEEEELFSLFRRLLAEGTLRPAGSRSINEILSRLHEKLGSGDTDEQLELGVSLAADLVNIKDVPAKALARGKRLAQNYGLAMDVINQIEEVIQLTEGCGPPQADLCVDMGLLRGLSYYTGIVFEIYVDVEGNDLLICGGGRYDGLVRALGGNTDVPALGFAYTLEHLVEVIRGGERMHPAEAAPQPQVLIIPATRSDFGHALETARDQSSQGRPAEIEVMDRALEQSLKYAAERGVEVVVVVENGETKDRYSFKDGGWTNVASGAAKQG